MGINDFKIAQIQLFIQIIIIHFYCHQQSDNLAMLIPLSAINILCTVCYGCYKYDPLSKRISV